LLAFNPGHGRSNDPVRRIGAPMGYRHRQGQWKVMDPVTLLASTTAVGFTIGAVIYVLLLITLGIISLRKGHWVMFIIGLFFPLFWFIGALLPRKNR
jgi:hypothetical protein